MKQEVDYLVLGKDYSSLILTNALLLQKKKVFFLEYENFSLGDLFSQKLGELEKQFLELFGDYRDISILSNLDLYLYKDPTHFSIGSRWLYLADCPASNLRELLRKFPEWFQRSREQY